MSEDKPKPAPTSNSSKPAGATPYRPGAAKFTSHRADITSLAPPQEPEPEIERGIDLTGRAKIIFAAGRGKTGKTHPAPLAHRNLHPEWRARRSSPTSTRATPPSPPISPMSHGLTRTTPPGLRRLAAGADRIFASPSGNLPLIDLGGGNTTLRSLAAEMPRLATHIEAAGMAPAIFHLTGPQPEDLLPALTLAARGFTPQQRRRWCSTNMPSSRVLPANAPSAAWQPHPDTAISRKPA